MLNLLLVQKQMYNKNLHSGAGKREEQLPDNRKKLPLQPKNSA
jgi:hypothetical protein